ncbi:unnamed protein product [Bursaphelenchus xylophilus]|uniref:(pine wood nematode) hypothetical protein n=1 Tax=Bursaphelenchus xylophilus TaxID=6326 RepID=A0A7I8WWV3_BURXY|nr:unnamed protein product [Bursaphelenchus xylophilus]CAG9099752.1 unnamed protein product [Bursaphelenchus xylophilus]
MAGLEVHGYSDVRWVQGVVINDQQSPEVVNEVYEFGHYNKVPLTVRLSPAVFLKYRPNSGRHRCATYFPIGTRLLYQRAGRNIIRFDVMGTFNFAFCRAVRGIGDNSNHCFVDLLEMILPLRGNGGFAPPGVSFHLTIGYNLIPKATGPSLIEFYVESVERISFESILFDGIPWPIHGVITYQTQPDYNRKYEPLSFIPKTYLVYLGGGFFFSHRYEEMPLVKLGFDAVPNLEVGQIYISCVIQSRLDCKCFTHQTIRKPQVKDQEELRIDFDELHQRACQFIKKDLPR